MEARHKGRHLDERRAENSWVQIAAKVLCFLVSPFVFPLEDVGGREGHTPFLCNSPFVC